MAQQLLIWDSEVTSEGSGRSVVTARRPLFRLSVKQASAILSCSEWTVSKLYRAGLISGWKPGGVAMRRDGRRSNAALVLDAGSVLSYKESVTRRGVF